MKKKKLIYDEQKAREFFSKIAKENYEFVPLSKEVLKHLPATHDGCYLLTWNITEKRELTRIVTYLNFDDYGSFKRGPGMCSTFSTFAAVAEQVKLAHYIRNDKSVLGTLKK